MSIKDKGFKICLSSVNDEDVEDMFYIVSKEEVTRFMESGFFPTSRQQCREYLDAMNSSTKECYFSIKKLYGNRNKGVALGFIKLQIHSWVHGIGEIGYMLDPEYSGKGYTTEAIKLAISHGFNILNLQRIQAQCVVENVASRRVLMRNKFIAEGTLRNAFYYNGNYYDKLIYSILREEYVV